MRSIDAIIRAYEQQWYAAAHRGVCSPPPKWEEVGALIEEVIRLRAEAAAKVTL